MIARYNMSFNIKDNYKESYLDILNSKVLILKELIQKFKDDPIKYKEYQEELNKILKEYPEAAI